MQTNAEAAPAETATAELMLPLVPPLMLVQVDMALLRWLMPLRMPMRVLLRTAVVLAGPSRRLWLLPLLPLLSRLLTRRLARRLSLHVGPPLTAPRLPSSPALPLLILLLLPPLLLLLPPLMPPLPLLLSLLPVPEAKAAGVLLRLLLPWPLRLPRMRLLLPPLRIRTRLLPSPALLLPLPL